MNEVGSSIREDRLLTVREASQYLRLSKSQVYLMVARRQLPYIRVSPRRIVIREMDLKKWIEKQAQPDLF